MRRPTMGVTMIAVGALIAGAVPLQMLSAQAPQNVVAVQPSRVLDTRSAVGVPTTTKTVPGVALPVAFQAAADAGATSVAFNLTAVDADGPGWVKAWPCNEPVPPTSNLNVVPGRAVANAAMVKLSSGGICLQTSVPMHLVIDVSGWYTGTDDFTGSTPNRLLDTRVTGNPLQPGEARRLRVGGTPGVPADSTIAALNLTVDRPQAGGWVVAYPCDQPTNASTVNFRAGDIVANLTVVGLSNQDVCLRSLGVVDIVVDSYGSSKGTGKLRVTSPSRLLDTRDTGTWPSGKALSQSTITLSVAGRLQVPTDADGALLTVTVVNPDADGFVTVWPCDQPFPVASTINTWAGALRSNLAFVKLTQDTGTACLQYRGAVGATDLVVDVVGWTTGGPQRSNVPTVIGTVTPPPAPPAANGGPTGPVTPPPPGSLEPNGAVQWSEDFSTAASLDRMIFAVNSGDHRLKDPVDFMGDHDMNCGAPTTLRPMHETHLVADHVWWCAPGGDPAKGHFMTGMATLHYIIISFTPKGPDGRAMIFPESADQVCWDQNLTNLGERKWTQLVVVSDDQYLANAPAIDYVNPVFNANGTSSIQLGPDAFLMNNLGNQANFFKGQQSTAFGGQPLHNSTDKATRYETCVRDNHDGTVTRTQARPFGDSDTFTAPGSFPAGPRVFILEDDSYNPDKQYNGAVPLSDSPYTWHWDNIEIS